MGISVGGLSSGIDVDKIISQLIAIEKQPQVRLQVKEATLQGKLTSMGSIMSSLTSLQSAASSLRDLNALNLFSAASSDTTIFTASTNSTATPGVHSVEVKQLAQAHRLASIGFADTTTTAVGTGTLTIQVGTGTSKTITIDSTNNTLTGLRNAINNAGAGVSASILNDGTGNKLIITANNSGSSNTIKITVVDNDGNNTDMNGISRFVYDPGIPVTNLTQTQAAQNATLKVDGIDNISKSSNTVSDVIQGVTLNLIKAQVGTTVTLNITQDATLKSKIQGFVDEYNKMTKLLNDLQAYDPKTKKGGVLIGDSVVRDIRQKIRTVITNPVLNLSGAYTSLGLIGIKSNSDGALTIDNAKLDSAIASNPTAVTNVFAKNTNITDPNITFKGTTKDTVAGIYNINITQAAAKGKYTGTSITLPATITSGTNDTLTLSIDGVSSTIVLAAGTYNTGSDLAQEVQNKINSNSTFTANGISVSVNFLSGTNQLEITSSTIGSTSSVNVTGGSAWTSLGLSSGIAVQGANVQGTINGRSTTGVGNRLTGTTGNPENGLSLEVNGSTTGNRGTVTLTYGVAEQLYNEIGKIVDPITGPINKRKDAIKTSIDDIGKENAKIERRLAETEKNLRERFTQLEKTLSRLQATNNFLTQQFQSIFTNNSK